MNPELRKLIEEFHALLKIPTLPADLIRMTADKTKIAELIKNPALVGLWNKLQEKEPKELQKDPTIFMDGKRGVRFQGLKCTEFAAYENTYDDDDFEQFTQFVAETFHLDPQSDEFKNLFTNLRQFHGQDLGGFLLNFQQLNFLSQNTEEAQSLIILENINNYLHRADKAASYFYVDNTLYVYSIVFNVEYFDTIGNSESIKIPGASTALFKLTEKGYELVEFGFSNSLQHDLAFGTEPIYLKERAALAEEESYQIALAALNKHLSDQPLPPELLKAKKAVLSEIEAIKHGFTSPEERQERMPLLTAVLMETARSDMNLEKYAQLQTEVSQHAWAKRLGGAMLGVLAIALIAACITLAVLTFGVGAIITIPVMVGFAAAASFSVASAIESGLLLVSGFKNKPVEVAMDNVAKIAP